MGAGYGCGPEDEIRETELLDSQITPDVQEESAVFRGSWAPKHARLAVLPVQSVEFGNAEQLSGCFITDERFNAFFYPAEGTRELFGFRQPHEASDSLNERGFVHTIRTDNETTDRRRFSVETTLVDRNGRETNTISSAAGYRIDMWRSGEPNANHTVILFSARNREMAELVHKTVALAFAEGHDTASARALLRELFRTHDIFAVAQGDKHGQPGVGKGGWPHYVAV